MSPLTKEGLKAYGSLESYSPFASGWVKEVKIKLFFYTTCWNYLGCWTVQYVMYFLLHFTIWYKLRALYLLLRLKFQSVKGASRHQAFMGNCQTINHRRSIYLEDESLFLFLLILPHRPTQQRAGWRNLVRGVFVDVYTNGGWFCWNLILVCRLGVDFESTCTV